MEQKTSINNISLVSPHVDIQALFSVIHRYVLANIQANGWELLSALSLDEIEQKKELRYSVNIAGVGTIEFFYQTQNYQHKNPYAAWQTFRQELRTDFGMVSIMAQNPSLYEFAKKYTGFATSISHNTFGFSTKIKLDAVWSYSEQLFFIENYLNAVWRNSPFWQKISLSPEIEKLKKLYFPTKILSVPRNQTLSVVVTASLVDEVAASMMGQLDASQIRWLRDFTMGAHTRFHALDDQPLPKELMGKLKRSLLSLRQQWVEQEKEWISKACSEDSYNTIVIDDKLLNYFIDYLDNLYYQKFAPLFAIFKGWRDVYYHESQRIVRDKNRWKRKLYSHITNLSGKYEGIDLEGACSWLNTFALSYVLMLIHLGLGESKPSQSLHACVHSYMNKNQFKEDISTILVFLSVAMIVNIIRDSLWIEDNIKKALNDCSTHDFNDYLTSVDNVLQEDKQLSALVDVLYQTYQEDGYLLLLSGYSYRVNKTKGGEVERYTKRNGSHTILVMLNKEAQEIVIFNTGMGYDEYHITLPKADKNAVYPYVIKMAADISEQSLKEYIKRVLVCAALPKTIYLDNQSPIELALPLLYNQLPKQTVTPHKKPASRSPFIKQLSLCSEQYIKTHFNVPLMEQVVGNCSYTSVEHYLLLALPFHQDQYQTLLNCMGAVVNRWQAVEIKSFNQYTTAIRVPRIGVGTQPPTKETSNKKTLPVIKRVEKQLLLAPKVETNLPITPTNDQTAQVAVLRSNQ